MIERGFPVGRGFSQRDSQAHAVRMGTGHEETIASIWGCGYARILPRSAAAPSFPYRSLQSVQRLIMLR